MKKMMMLIFATSLFFIFIQAKAMINEYEEIAKSNIVDVSLYAKKMNGDYTDFKIDFRGSMLSRPYWINTANPTFSPLIKYEDINNDGKNELIIILTKGTGTGILEQEAHVFHIQNQKVTSQFVEVTVEVLVDDPMAIVFKNVKSELLPTTAQIEIGDKEYTIDIKPLDIQADHLFANVYFGNKITFDVKDYLLIAKIGAQIAPAGGYIGDIHITYMFKDKMYQAKSIEFKPYKP
ncbi:hypothetical protein ACQKNX_02810 [Lysinibacillus sp. NPDC093712]|uniref:hypothetical protein n=1 Tax=Lysinibacillus sp. NPDC093712 TaxID=3390579 RepID=UPI003D041BE3